MKVFLAVILLSLLGFSFINVAESRPSNSIEGTEDESRSKRDASVIPIGSTIVGGSHNFGVIKNTQTTQSITNNGNQPLSSTITKTIQETPGLSSTNVITVGEKDSQTYQTITQKTPDVFGLQWVCKLVPQKEYVKIINTNGYQTIVSDGDQLPGTQIISQSDGTTITQSPHGQVIKTPGGTLTQGIFGRKRRSPHSFGFHNFGPFGPNVQSFDKFGPSRQFITTTHIQQPGNYVIECKYEKSSNPGNVSTVTKIQTPLERQDRSAQWNGAYSSYAGGSHNFGTSYSNTRYGNTGVWGGNFHGSHWN